MHARATAAARATTAGRVRLRAQMLLRLLLAAFRILTAPLYFARRLMGRPRGRFVELRIGPRVTELSPPLPWWVPFVAPPSRLPTNLLRVEKLVEALARDPRRDGLLLVIDPLEVGWATAEAIRAVLEPLRAAGKQTVAYLPRGGGPKELFVALGCDRIVISPPASLLLPGLTAAGTYAAKLLERLGIRVERFARREYKTAYENLERDSMSEGQRYQLTAIVSGLGRAMDEALGARSMPARAALEERGWADAAWLEAQGVVAARLYEDELPRFLGLDPKKERFVPAGTYLAYASQRFLPRLRRRDQIAVIPLHGVIGEGSGPGGTEKTIAALRHAAVDKRTKAVVLHVDSPGGSALGSDLVHREVQRLARRKPVVASFGDVAASGGYYVAAPAHAIVARGSTLTGSIGVIAARPSLAGALEKLGLVRETVGGAPHETFFDLARPLDPATRAVFEREIDVSYGRFVEVVAEGRKRDATEIEPLARGRVYLGRAAAELGLVDGLGGLPEALERARSLVRQADPRAVDLAVRVIQTRSLEPIPPIADEASQLALALGLSLDGPRLSYFEPDVLPFLPRRVLELPMNASLGLSSGHGAMKRMRQLVGSLLMLVLVGCGGAQLARVNAGNMPQGGTFHGVWYSPQYGDMHLCQSTDGVVVGEYTKNERHGTVRGRVDGDLLHFEWREEREFIPGRPTVTSGHGYFRISRTLNDDGSPRDWSIDGQWGTGEDEVGGGPWTAVLQPRTSPDNCYNSIRRRAPSSTAPSSDEIRFADEPTPAPATP